MGEQEWYSNRELFEQIQELKQQITELCQEMARTTAVIREYNGLRTRLGECERQIANTVGQHTGGREMWGYIVGAVGVGIAIISVVVR